MTNWREHYTHLFELMREVLDFNCDLTFELITHRFTPGSKEVLKTWYPQSKLNMNEDDLDVKRNKFGGVKYVYDSNTMKQLRQFFESTIQRDYPTAQILYWT